MAAVTTNFLVSEIEPAVRQTRVAGSLRYLEDEINRVVHEAARLVEATADVRLGGSIPAADCNECRVQSGVVLADRLDALGDRIGALADLLCESANRTEL